METVIEKNVEKPIPDTELLAAKTEAMEIGDSFLWPLIKRTTLIEWLRKTYHAEGKGVKRFSTSTKGQPAGMFRVWREKDAVIAN